MYRIDPGSGISGSFLGDIFSPRAAAKKSIRPTAEATNEIAAAMQDLGLDLEEQRQEYVTAPRSEFVSKPVEVSSSNVQNLAKQSISPVTQAAPKPVNRGNPGAAMIASSLNTGGANPEQDAITSGISAGFMTGNPYVGAAVAGIGLLTASQKRKEQAERARIQAEAEAIRAMQEGERRKNDIRARMANSIRDAFTF